MSTEAEAAAFFEQHAALARLRAEPGFDRGLTLAGLVAEPTHAVRCVAFRKRRMHDRLVYRRSGDGWTVERLAP